ncbi:MAG: hypothetical protein COV31_00350 [Candidatus Yanofskybacteria bacterium CG10_big_fil_rev_8_21_14_0_10_46_23]|uniref:J domain-containing protein n=1 Tax=Candidatus Yanofskybacteria bacterium CG10_big_fil_rev_8_21_14_0_10_46_23 TaxID=1975098 RepID=A0A2H0R5D9_9BACT|nr:MAG: hypothetical protein COV31_00350 [Candidatus Yanofskybacteria bacterium CG10_big_fil_rev_8_21_14_0_10_46_23]
MSGHRQNIKRSILALVIIIAGLAVAFLLTTARPAATSYNQPQEAFIAELYDLIQEKYWDTADDARLTDLFQRALEKTFETQISLQTNDKAGLISALPEILGEAPDEATLKKLALAADITLTNLEPFGRSRLFSQKQQQELSDRVRNVDPQIDLFSEIGVPKEASEEEIATAYNQKIAELQAEPATEATEQKLALLSRAFETLGDETSRKQYTETGAEATVVGKYLAPEVFYLKIKQFSPETFNEFIRVANASAEDGSGDAIIIDLRGNIGGAVDTLPYFLGPFIGNNQYAYDFFHQGEYTPYKTKVGWLESLVPFKKVAILIDSQSQSSAEIMAATLKKYNVGTLIGTTTRGWGTIEQVFPLEHQISPTETYSAFLVHSLTLRNDNQPIEGRGVDPTIDINNPAWTKELAVYFGESPINREIEKLLN